MHLIMHSFLHHERLETIVQTFIHIQSDCPISTLTKWHNSMLTWATNVEGFDEFAEHAIQASNYSEGFKNPP